MKNFKKLTKLQTGDQVGIISPSAGLPGLFPWIQDLGLQRLKEVFKLDYQEYSTTRTMNSSLQDRATDIMAAFRDPKNKAIFASIGGEDQIRLIKYLDPDIFLNNPKPFFGFSDNTHLHNFLWGLGIPSYYGGSVMTELAFQQKIPAITEKYLALALFEEKEVELEVSTEFNDIGLDFSIQENLLKSRLFEPNDGLYWEASHDAQGILWGGCLESLVVQCSSEKYLPSTSELENTILLIETAEDIPEPWIVDSLLTGFGERGWFDVFQAVLVGRPKAWEFDKQNNQEQKSAFKKQQRETITTTIRQYNRTIPIIQNLDFGHTAPQIVMPYGGLVKINHTSQKITLSY